MGNSGSPVFNMDGQVIGIISHILSKSGGFEGIAFAATSNMVKQVLFSGIGFWTGIETFPLDPILAKVFNLPQPGGVLVEKVAKGSISDDLGLQAGAITANIDGKKMIVGGDIILSVMDVKLYDEGYQEKVKQRLSLLISGDKIYVKILRSGEVMWLSAAFKKQAK
jgi:S1-C subfamily serine protease